MKIIGGIKSLGNLKSRDVKRKRIVTAVLTAAFIFSLILLRVAFKNYLRKAYPTKHSELVLKYSEEYDFEPSLIYAIIHTESGFKNNAVSRADAKGLMQITGKTFEWALYRERLSAGEANPEAKREGDSEIDLFDPEINIKYGVMILSLLRETYPLENTFVAAYNAGYGSVEDWLLNPKHSTDGETLHSIPFPETENYVKKVKSAKDMYEKLS